MRRYKTLHVFFVVSARPSRPACKKRFKSFYKPPYNPPGKGCAASLPRIFSRFFRRRWGLPRANQQSTGLLVARCGAPPCSPPHHGYTKKRPQAGHSLLHPVSFRASFAADGVSRGLTNSPPDCWLRAAARRPVRPLTTAIRKAPGNLSSRGLFVCRWWGSNPHGVTTNGF